MAVPKRKSEYLGLKNIDVLVRDTSFESEYFNVLECPSILSQGKSSFLISGGDRLRPGVDIKMELVNNQTQETVYLEPIKGHLEGNARRVTIEIYEDITPGAHTLYIIGELNPDWYLENIGESIPTEWEDIYNVRWSKSISVNAAAVNTQPIFFYKQPTISVSEIFKEFVQVPSSSAIINYLTGSGVPRDGVPIITPTQNSTEEGFGEATYPELDFANKAKDVIIEENKATTKLRGNGGALGSKGKIVKTMSPVPDDYLINVSGDSSVDSLYVGNRFQINNPSVDSSKFTLETYHSVPTVYSSSIMRVLNNKTFVPKDIFYVNDNRTTPPTLVPAPFASIWPVTSSYYNLGTQTTSSINFFAYADITVGDLRTFSGDVHKFKIYAKSEGTLGDFELIYDSPLESTQVLYDKDDATSLNNIGYFLDVDRVNKYWDMYQGVNGNGGTGTLGFDSTYKIDSMKISGSNYGVDESLRVEHTTLVDFVKGTLYSFKAKIYGTKSLKLKDDGTEESQASFKVYASGNAFDGDTDDGTHWGFEKLNMPDIPDGLTEYDFGTVEGNFIASHTGTGRIQFKVDSGIWYVSDISVKTATDTAFNPESIRVTTPLPPLKDRPDSLRFLVEFYDVNNNIADSIVFSEPVSFQGANINISGTDNILSGSMFIGSSIDGGVEMAGVNSAFIKSVGYQGFVSASNAEGNNSGFMFYSGSVLPNSGDDYKGVGLELVGHSGSYFKFGTEPSELDIRTDKFFVGNQDLQFISGSDGNIEISSSNFHLSASGDVNMSGTVTATAGNIGGWQIIDNKLSGSNATLDASGAALYMSNKGPNTDDDASFDILRDEFYIDFTPSDQDNTTNYFVKFGPNFAVSSAGVLHASGAIFEGTITASAGNIGGANIESASLTFAPFWRISSSNAQDDPVSFISSSKFKVSAGGNVTGSQVLFTGGKVGGWTMTDTTLTGGVVTLNSAGSIEIGGLADATTVATTNSGFFADSSGNVLIKGNVSNNNYLKVTAAGTIDIKAVNFDLATDNLIVDSGTNSGMISLGATPNTAISGTGKGVYMDGTGDFLIYGSATNFIKFDAAGTSLTINSDTFDLLTSTQHISSSNGGIIAMGSTIPTQLDDSGIMLSGSGEFNFQVDEDNFIRQTGDSFDIKSENFGLKTSKMLISSSLNDGTIALGATPPTSIITNSGFYVDGTGDVLIGDADGARLTFDGTNFVVSSSKFLLGELASSFISGSDSNIEISSSAFHLTAEGNVTASNIILGDKAEGDFLQFANGVLTVQGDVSADNIRTPATIAGTASTTLNASSSITSEGFARFVSASIGGWDVTSDSIQAGTTLILSSSLNSGTILLGAATTIDSGDGVYMDGTGNAFRVGNPAGNEFKFDGTSVYIGNDGAEHIKVDGTSLLFIENSTTMAELRGTTWTIGGAHGATDDAISLSPDNGVTIFDSSTDKLVIDSDGMTLTENNQVRAIFGAITAIGSAGAAVTTTSTDDVIRIANGTVSIFQDDNNKAVVNSAGMVITQGGTAVGKFGAITTIGDTSNEHISASSAGIHIHDGATVVGSFKATGAIIGDDSTAHISASTLDVNLIQDSDNLAKLSTVGLEVTQSGAGVASFGANTTLTGGTITLQGTTGTIGDEKLVIENNSISIFSVGAEVFDVTGAVVTVGSATDKVTINGTSGITIRENNVDTIQMVNGVVTVGSSTDKVTINGTSGITIKENNVDTIQMVNGVVTVGSSTDNVKIDGTSGITIRENNADTITLVDGTITLKTGTSGHEKLVMSDASIAMFTNNAKVVDIADGKISLGPAANAGASNGAVIGNIHLASGGAFIYGAATNDFVNVKSDAVDVVTAGVTQASFGALTTIGDTANEHISASSAGIHIHDGATVVGSFKATGAIIGDDSTAHISASTLDINLIQDSDNLSKLSSAGLEVTQSGTGVASFGANTTLTGGTITLQGTTGTIGDDRLVIGSANIEMYANNSKVVDVVDGKISIGPAANAGATNGAVIGNIHLASGGAFIYGAATDDFVNVKSDGVDVVAANKVQAAFGATTKIGVDENNSTFVQIDSDSVDIIEDVSGTNNTVASFGVATVIGPVANSKSRITLGSGKVSIINRDGSGNDSTVISLDASGDAVFSGSINALSGEIGGWELGSTTLTGDNLVLNSAGILQTANYASGVQGWRISSANNGEAEFEKVTIRGTLATTVFEKESVNAVGGQLYIANSTIISASADIAASDTTIGVANVGGFTGSSAGDGEIISAKKILDTGFSTEYMLVTSASRNDPSSDTDFSGKLFLVRGYSGSNHTASGSVGDTAKPAQTYTNGQVIVSTGRVGTGFIRLNANPNDSATPYIDIVERTGSNVFDVDLKARLGDLSGLSSAQVGATPGFGLFTERAFLTQDVTVGTLGSEHITVDGTSVRFIDNTTTMAELRGTTWTIGGAHGATDDVIVLSPGGGVSIQDSSTDKIVVDSDGVTLTENNQVRAIFGAVTAIGSAGAAVAADSTDDVIRIADGTVSIFQDDNNKAVVNASGLTVTQGGNVVGVFAATSIIGSSTDKVTIDNSGITLRENNVDTIQIASGIVAVGDVANEHISMSTAGMTVRDGETVLANFAADITLGEVGSNKRNVFIDADTGIKIRNNTTDIASFGADVTLAGGTVTIQGTTGTLGDDRLVIGSANIEMYANNAKVVDIVDGKINLGPAANAGATLGAVVGNIHLASTGAYIYGDHVQTFAAVTSAGLEVTEDNVKKAIFGAVSVIGSDGAAVTPTSTDDCIRIAAGTISIFEDDNNKAVLNSGTLTFTSAGNVNAIFGAVSVIGSDGAAVTATSTDDCIRIADGTISIFQDNTHKATVTSGGLKIFSGHASDTVAVFAATSIIGSSTDKVTIDNSGIIIRENNVDTIQIASGIVAVGDVANEHISMSTAGMTIKDGETVLANFKDDVTIGEVASNKRNVFIDENVGIKIRNNTTDIASFGDDITLVGGTLTLQSNADGGGNDDRVVIGNANIEMYANDAKVVDIIDGKINLGPAADASQTLGAVVGNIHLASTGAYIYGDHVETFAAVTSAGLEVTEDNVKKAIFGAVSVIGSDGGGVSPTSTDDCVRIGPGGVGIYQDSNNFASMSSAGMTVTQGGNEVAALGSDITLSGGTLTIQSTAGTLGDEKLVMSSANLSMYTAGKRRMHIDDSAFAIGRNGTTDISTSTTVDVIRISDGAVSIFETNNNKAVINSSGLTVTQGGNVVGVFGATTTIGINGTSAEHAVLNGAGLTIKDGSVTRAALHNTGSTLYGDDEETFTRINSSGMIVVEDQVTYAKFAAITTIGDTANEHISASSAGIHIHDGETVIGAFTADGVLVGDTSFTHLSSSTTNINIVDASGLVTASFGAITTIGTTANEHVKIDSAGLTVKDGSVTRATLHNTGSTIYGNDETTFTRVNSSGMSIVDNNVTQGTFAGGTISLFGGSGDDKMVLDSDGLQISEGGDVKTIVAGGIIALGGASGADVAVDSTDEVVRIDSDGVTLFNDSNNYTMVSASGMSVHSGGNLVGSFGSDVVLTGGTITIQGTTGAIGHERLVMGSAELSMYTNNTRRMHVDDSAFAIGRNGTTDISTSTTVDVIRISDGAVSIFETNNNKAVINSSGLTVTQGGNVVGVFGATTTIGINGTTAEHAVLNSAGLTIKDGSVTKAALHNTGSTIYGPNDRSYARVNAEGISIVSESVQSAFFGETTIIGAIADDTSRIELGSGKVSIINRQGSTDSTVISLDSAGDAVFSGSINAQSGEIGGWELGSTTLTGGNVILNSAGSIAVGDVTLATATNTTRKGFIADNDGNVLIKGDDNDTNYIKFDADGGGSALEIKTANFSVLSGNVTMAGTVTATAGAIGGFGLTATTITGSGIEMRSGTNAKFVLHQNGGNVDGLVIARNTVPTVGNVSNWNFLGDSTFASITSSNAFIDMNAEFNVGTGNDGTNSSLGTLLDQTSTNLNDTFPATECFIAGTKIWMEDGTEKNIEDVEVGEIVSSYNVISKHVEYRKVTNLFTQEHLKEEDDVTVKLWFDNGTFVHATIANPFIVEGKEGVTAWDPKRGERVYTWIEEKWNQLEIGDEIIFNNGLTLEKTKLVKSEVYYEQIRTYDIEVEHTHTFFANGILTHNSGRKFGLGATATFTNTIEGGNSLITTSDKFVGVRGIAHDNSSADVQAIGGYFDVDSADASGTSEYFGVVTPNRISVGDGTAAAPGLIFNSGVSANGNIGHDVDTGIFRAGTNILAISIAGTEAFRWNATYAKTNKHLIPNSDNAFTLGIDANRWSKTFTMDLDVEGDVTVDGHVKSCDTRGYFFFGESSNYTSTRYLDMAQSHQANSSDGILMGRAGSITGIAVNYNINSVTAAQNIGFGAPFSSGTFGVLVDGTAVFTTAAVYSSTGAKNAKSTQAIGVDTFSAGDVIQANNIITPASAGGAASAVTVGDVTLYVEITFDS